MLKNENKKVVGLSIGHILVSSTESNSTYAMETIDAQELLKRVRGVTDWISEVLNVQIDNEFYIITTEGDILLVDEVNSYQHILEGNAFLELRILDTDGSVWVLKIELVGSYNIISCS